MDMYFMFTCVMHRVKGVSHLSGLLNAKINEIRLCLWFVSLFCESDIDFDILWDGIVLIKTFFFKAKAVELHVSSQLLGIKKD